MAPRSDPPERGKRRDFPPVAVRFFELADNNAGAIEEMATRLATGRLELFRLRIEAAILRWQLPRGGCDDNGLEEAALEHHKRTQKLLDGLAKEWRSLKSDLETARGELSELRTTLGVVKPFSVGDFFIREKTIISLDLVDYQGRAKFLQEVLDGPQGVRRLDDLIQELIGVALGRIGVQYSDVVLKDTGDGTLLALDDPSIALTFADQFFASAREHNARLTTDSAAGFRLWFRLGAAEAVLDYRKQGSDKIVAASAHICDAVRLEGAGTPGELTIAQDCYAMLTEAERSESRFGAPVEIQDKHGQKYTVRRLCLDATAARDAEASGRWTPKS